MNNKTKGFSLIELIVTIAILAIVLPITFSIFNFGNNAYSIGGSQFDLQSSGRLASDIIRNKVRYASELVVEPSFDPGVTNDNYNYIYLSADSKNIMYKEGANAAISIANSGSSKVSYVIQFTKDSITSNAIRFSETIPSSPTSGKLLNYIITMSSTSGKTYSIENEVTLMNSSYVAIAPPPIAGPSASPEEGVVAPSTNITLTSSVGGEIYYTLDGSVPTSSSNLYSTPIVLSTSVNLKAIVIKDGESSSVASYYYTVSSKPVVSDITFTKVNGSGPNPDRLTVSYTYKSPLNLNQSGTTIRWIGIKNNGEDSLTSFNDLLTITLSSSYKAYRVVITPRDVNNNVGDPVTKEFNN